MREANMAAPYMAMNVGGKRRKFAFFLTSETARPFRAAAAGTLAAPVRGGHGPHRGADPRTR